MKKFLSLIMLISILCVASLPVMATDYDANGAICDQVTTPQGAQAWNIFNETGKYLFSANYVSDTVYVNGDNVNIRVAPTTKSSVVKKVSKGTQLSRVGDSPCTWDMVMVDGKICFIYDSFISKNNTATVAATGTSSLTTTPIYTGSYLKRMGTFKWNGYRWTWYSQRVLPGKNLKIPGRHVDENGYVCDENNYICLASGFMKKGTVVNTPLGKQGKIYDWCGTANTLDVYVNW